MITFTFYLLYPERETSIVMGALRLNRNRVTLSAGIRVESKYWDKKAQCVTKGSSDHAFISEKLASLKTIALKEIRTVELEELSLSEIRDKIFIALGKIDKPVTTDDLLTSYRKWATTSINQHTANRQHLQCFRVLEEYASSQKVQQIAFDSIDYIFYTNFTKYLRVVKAYKVNTIATHVKNLKAVMNEAYKQKLHTNTEFKNFTKVQEEVDNVYLTIDELSLIYNLSLSGTKAAVRDLFLIGCYTGMRFGDYSRMTIYDISGEFIRQ